MRARQRPQGNSIICPSGPKLPLTTTGSSSAREHHAQTPRLFLPFPKGAKPEDRFFSILKAGALLLNGRVTCSSRTGVRLPAPPHRTSEGRRLPRPRGRAERPRERRGFEGATHRTSCACGTHLASIAIHKTFAPACVGPDPGLPRGAAAACATRRGISMQKKLCHCKRQGAIFSARDNY